MSIVTQTFTPTVVTSCDADSGGIGTLTYDLTQATFETSAAVPIGWYKRYVYWGGFNVPTDIIAKATHIFVSFTEDRNATANQAMFYFRFCPVIPPEDGNKLAEWSTVLNDGESQDFSFEIPTTEYSYVSDTNYVFCALAWSQHASESGTVQILNPVITVQYDSTDSGGGDGDNGGGTGGGSAPITGRLLVHNLDTGKWQVPWSTKATAIHSGETADGVVDLIVALNGTTLCKLTPENFTDNGAEYNSWVRGNLFDLSGDRTTGQSAVVDYIEIERNTVPLTDVLQANDENTQVASAYRSIVANEEDPPQRNNGTEIVAKRYMSQPQTSACKRASFELHWGVSLEKFELYTIDIGHHPGVSR